MSAVKYGYSKDGWGTIKTGGGGSSGYGSRGSGQIMISTVNQTIMPEYDVISYMTGTTIHTETKTGSPLTGASTNMGTHVNAAITYLMSIGKGRYYIASSPNDYDGNNTTIDLTTASNIEIVGSGMFLTVLKNLKFTRGSNAATIRFADMTINANSNLSNCINLGTNATDCMIERVKMMNSSSSFLLQWSSVDHLIVDTCIFYDGGLTVSADDAAGSQLKTTENQTVFRDCLFIKENSLGGAMLTTGGTGNLLIDGCIMWDKSAGQISYAAVSIENSFGSCKEIKIVNSRGYGKTQGFHIGNATTNQIDLGLIDNSTSTDVQLIRNAKDAKISNGLVYNSPYGYYMTNNTVAKLEECTARNTNYYGSGTTSDKGGFFGDANTHLSIENLHVYDDQGTATTPYGIRINSGTNVFIDNATMIGPFVISPLYINSVSYLQIMGGQIVGNPTLTSITSMDIFSLKGYTGPQTGSNTIFDYGGQYTGAEIADAGVRTGIVSQYAFAGGVTDSVGANNLTATGAPTYSTSGVFGQAIVLDGSSMYLQPANNTIFDQTTGDFSISAWVYRTADSGLLEYIVSKRLAGAPGYSIYIGTNDKVNAELRDSAAGAAITTTSSTTLEIGSWYHILAVWSRAGNCTIYINGIEDGTPQDISSQALTLTNTQTFTIGRYSNAGSNYLTSRIDDLRVYSAALSAAQAIRVYSEISSGMLLFCKKTESGFTTGSLYMVNLENTAILTVKPADPVVSLISLDSTGGNATVPNADTDIVTYSLGVNTYSKIMIEGDIEVVTGVLSTVQNITFKAKIGASTNSYVVPAVNVAGRTYCHVTMQATQTGAATMAISHGAAAADANTTDYVHNLYVWGIV